ncbi:hypothetical protein Tco_1293179 [Tanacetum coccineum]
MELVRSRLSERARNIMMEYDCGFYQLKAMGTESKEQDTSSRSGMMHIYIKKRALEQTSKRYFVSIKRIRVQPKDSTTSVMAQLKQKSKKIDDDSEFVAKRKIYQITGLFKEFDSDDHVLMLITTVQASVINVKMMLGIYSLIQPGTARDLPKDNPKVRNMLVLRWHYAPSLRVLKLQNALIESRARGSSIISTFRVILFSIHNDEWKSFQCHHQTALRINREPTDPHATFECQPMNEDYYHEQNSCYDPNSFGFDQFQPPHFYTITSFQIFNSQNELMEQMTSICDMVGQYLQKNEEEKRITEDQAAKDRYWKIPICYDDDDDEESSIPLKDIIISGLPP